MGGASRELVSFEEEGEFPKTCAWNVIYVPFKLRIGRLEWVWKGLFEAHLKQIEHYFD